MGELCAFGLPTEEALGVIGRRHDPQRHVPEEEQDPARSLLTGDM